MSTWVGLNTRLSKSVGTAITMVMSFPSGVYIPAPLDQKVAGIVVKHIDVSQPENLPTKTGLNPGPAIPLGPATV